MKQKIKVWDLPTRLFHWTLAAAVAFMWYSAKTGGGMLVWHLRCGLLILALTVFRLCWGLWGSDTARFAQFVKGRTAIADYLSGRFSEDKQPGHNPLGALMVLALLATVAFQTATGLFAADENTFTTSGWLNGWVGSETGSLMRRIHIRFFNLLAALAAIHIISILLYKFLRKTDLVKPMITGFKYLGSEAVRPRFAGRIKLVAALFCAAAAAALVWVLSKS